LRVLRAIYAVAGMKRTGRRGVLLAGVAAMAAVSPAVPGAARSVYIPIPSLEFPVRASLKPEVPQGRNRIPVSLHIGGKIRKEYSRVPELREVQFEGDRHGEIDVAGLPACGRGKLPTGPPPSERCAEAIVGTGSANVETAFPENKPMNIETELAVYNAGIRGRETRLWIYGYLSPIEPGPVLVPVRIRRVNNGRYGWKAVATVPSILKGHGSITELDLTLQKRILAANCPGDKLQGTIRSRFSDGTFLQSTSIQECG
jgi:hypothetical protein